MAERQCKKAIKARSSLSHQSSPKFTKKGHFGWSGDSLEILEPTHLLNKICFKHIWISPNLTNYFLQTIFHFYMLHGMDKTNFLDKIFYKFE